MLELKFYGNPVLRKVGEKITMFDDNFRKFVVDMVETMRIEDGVGLAAPQVGESVQLAVIDITNDEKPPIILVNPEVIWLSEETEEREEGCLSVPDISLKVTRPASISVKAQDEFGKEFIIEKATDLLARALQHEIDHLNGILFVDKLTPLQRSLISGKLKKIVKHGRGVQDDS